MIQVYTGSGKGKTSAALGLALRAAGAGMRVYIAQFLKKGAYNELKILKKINKIKIEQFGTGYFIKRKLSSADIELASKGLNRVKKNALDKKFDLIILDEINLALHYKLFKSSDLLEMAKNSKDVEFVFTGSHCTKQIIKQADLVSDIKELKHYFKKGIKARRGIEF